MFLENLADFLVERRRSGDAEQALKHITRCLELGEGLLRNNHDSALDMRLVSMDLIKLADLLILRGQPGDAEQAFKHYSRSLDLAIALLKRSPSSLEALRDVSWSREKLADYLVLRGQAGDARQALEYYTDDLECLERLIEANPGSAQAAQDLVLCHLKFADFAARTGDKSGAEKHRRACYDILQSRVSAGMFFNSTTMNIYRELYETFGK